MRYYEILMEMTRAEAVAIFKKHGADPDSSNLSAVRNTLAKKYHPDVGGDDETLKLINAAYDVLKNSPSSGGSRSSGGYYKPEDTYEPPQRRHGQYEPWAQAGHSGGMPNNSTIYRNDYRDVNFIKKRMWELSGESTQEWRIQGFDGSFMRNSVTVYGSRKIFKHMAEAMVTWQVRGGNSYPCRAVLVQRRGSSDHTLYIIWADGVFYSNDPIPFEYDRTAHGRARYDNKKGRHFTEDERLADFLDDLKENGRPHEQPEMDVKGSTSELKNMETGSYVFHKKFGVGRVLSAPRLGMVRVAFTDRVGNVRANSSSLRPATKAEKQQFDAAQ